MNNLSIQTSQCPLSVLYASVFPTLWLRALKVTLKTKGAEKGEYWELLQRRVYLRFIGVVMYPGTHDTGRRYIRIQFTTVYIKCTTKVYPAE